jgi:hypothetical protein
MIFLERSDKMEADTIPGMTDADLEAIVESGDYLPMGLYDMGEATLPHELMANPVFDGTRIVEGGA